MELAFSNGISPEEFRKTRSSDLRALMRVRSAKAIKQEQLRMVHESMQQMRGGVI